MSCHVIPIVTEMNIQAPLHFVDTFYVYHSDSKFVRCYLYFTNFEQPSDKRTTSQEKKRAKEFSEIIVKKRDNFP